MILPVGLRDLASIDHAIVMQAPLWDKSLIHEEGSVLTLEELITSKQGRSNIESLLWQ
jgi:hypothetical protein